MQPKCSPALVSFTLYAVSPFWLFRSSAFRQITQGHKWKSQLWAPWVSVNSFEKLIESFRQCPHYFPKGLVIRKEKKKLWHFWHSCQERTMLQAWQAWTQTDRQAGIMGVDGLKPLWWVLKAGTSRAIAGSNMWAALWGKEPQTSYYVYFSLPCSPAFCFKLFLHSSGTFYLFQTCINKSERPFFTDSRGSLLMDEVLNRLCEMH